MYISMILLVSCTLKGIKTDKDIIPVFLMDLSGVMDHLKVEPNPFTKLGTAFFASIIHDAIKSSKVIIVFVEDHFSVEDISLKDKMGTPYHHLHQGLIDSKVKYFPKVIDPYKLLNQVFQPQQFNVFYMSSGTKIQMFDGHFKHFFIFFRDGKNETRAEALRGHDLIMKEVYYVVRQLAKGPVVAFYTGKMNPVQSQKIEFIPTVPMEAAKHPGVMVVTDGALFRFVGVFAATHHRRALFNQVPIIAEETWTSESLSTKMAYTDFELEFNFSFKDHGWLLDSVVLLEGGEVVGRTYMAVGARWNWAYYCGDPLVLVNTRDGSSVTISEYKIQPMRSRRRRSYYDNFVHGRAVPTSATQVPSKSNEPIDGTNSTVNVTLTEKTEKTASLGIARLADTGGAGDDGGKGGDDSAGQEGAGDDGGKGGGDDTEKDGMGDGDDDPTFGHTVNCGPYYTAGILAGLFVVSICCVMLTVALVAFANVHTNDKYDDPHGKVLVLGIER